MSLRVAAFHGIGIGICGAVTKSLFAAYLPSLVSWRYGWATLGVCAVLLLLFYTLAVLIEAAVVAFRGCQSCSSHRLWLAA